ncbi:MAG TPA: response regulator [Thermoanaerobaculia bacterium]|nr:response regulator [Thermoanaerobaculia bacterium]
MPLLTIRLFGDLAAVDHRGDALSVGSRRTQAAIVWMALHLDAEAPLRDFEALFGDDAAMLARDLQYAFRFLPTRLLQGDGPNLRFNPTAVEVDALRLQELDSIGSIPSLREAAELYRANLLDGFASAVEGYDEWLSAQRLRYWHIGVGVLGKLLAAQIRAGWWENAVDTAGRLLSLDPTQEVVHRTLMRLQLDQGRPDAALRRYQECADILRREFQGEPSAETEKVHEAILTALEQTPAPRDVFLKPLDRPVLILLVEDDLVSQALMEGFLADAGYEVIAVNDGADALMEIGRRRFDLLLLDINIPTLNGLRLFEIMIQKGIDTPAIFVSGVASPEVEARSLEIGASDFLRKPIRKETLLPRVRAIVQRRERERSAR